MSNFNGLFIALEGTDGSGKKTQFGLLINRLRDAGYDVVSFDFPQYERASSYFVKQYLNGTYGSVNSVNAYTSSLFYALDRFEAAANIKAALKAGKIVIANRFTGSNMAHQGTKFSHPEERRGFFLWLDNLEFQTLGIPRPDFSIVLRVPADIAQNLVDKKDKRPYTDRQRDIHESDINHLRLSVEVYDDMCQLFPKDFIRVDCTRGGQLLPVETITKLLWEKITPLLPPAPQPPLNKMLSQPLITGFASLSRPATDNPYINKKSEGTFITSDGSEYLNTVITNTTGSVYAFRNNISQTTIAAAMARLSRRGDDMRITLLDEFAASSGKDEKLLSRVITAYGDDSVQQLVGQHLVVEKASNLLTKKLEWGRLGAYLEQSTRYIYYDQTDSDGNYKFYVPKHLDITTEKLYKNTLCQIFELYKVIVHDLTAFIEKNSNTPAGNRDSFWRSAVKAEACDAARAVLPVATESTVGIFASAQAIESLIIHLLSDDLVESRQTGQAILEESRKVIPIFLERADKSDRGGATTAYLANTRHAVQQLADVYLPANYSDDFQSVKLTNVWPRNELEIVGDMLYEFSDQSLESIQNSVDQWTYDQKINVFKTYIGERLNRRHRPGRALEKIHYSWDIVCDYGIFRDLQRHRMVDDLEWQQLTPRYGYDIPPLIEKANLVDDFEKCFDLSLALYSQLQKAGYGLDAQYATLLGHKMRWKLTFNAREAFHLFELRTSPQGHPGYRKLVLEMYQKLSEVHPLICQEMNFTNKAEDPALNRLAAERYTQFKLQSLQ